MRRIRWTAWIGFGGRHASDYADARALDEAPLWDILLYASSHQITIEATCLELDVPSGTTTRDHLTNGLGDSPSDVLALEQRLNQALRRQLPRPFRKHLNSCPYDVAIDLVELPYYGKSHRHPQEVRRGPAKAGTTYFHCYATVAIVHDDQRYELALTFVWAKESLTAVVLRLLKPLCLLGVRVRCAYLDKGFSRVEIFRLLRQRRIPYVIPVPLRVRGLKALCNGRRSYQTRYTLQPSKIRWHPLNPTTRWNLMKSGHLSTNMRINGGCGRRRVDALARSRRLSLEIAVTKRAANSGSAFPLPTKFVTASVISGMPIS